MVSARLTAFKLGGSVGANSAASVARLPWDPGNFEPRNPFQHPRDVLAEVGHALMGVPQNTERYWPREQLIEFVFPLDQKFRHVIEIKRRILVIRQRLAEMKLAGQASAQDLLRTPTAEILKGRVCHLAVDRDITLPIGMNDAATRRQAAHYIVVHAQRVEHTHRVEEEMRRVDGIAADIEDHRHIARRGRS